MRFIVVMEGGLVQDIFTDQPATCLLIDKDTCEEVGADDSVRELVCYEKGETFTASVVDYAVLEEVKLVDHYFKQVKG